MTYEPDNRDKKVESRKKRQGYVQGKRSYLHAMVNSIAKRTQQKRKKQP
jgi:hypothetical protein